MTKKEILRKAMRSGKFFTVRYRKKDGELTTLNVHGGVKRNLKGGSNYARENVHITVFDCNRERKSGQGYRTLIIDGIEAVKFQGKEYQFTDELFV